MVFLLIFSITASASLSLRSDSSWGLRQANADGHTNSMGSCQPETLLGRGRSTARGLAIAFTRLRRFKCLSSGSRRL